MKIQARFLTSVLAIALASCSISMTTALVDKPGSGPKYVSAQNSSPLKLETNRIFISSYSEVSNGNARAAVGGGVSKLLAIFDLAELEKTPFANWDIISKQIPNWPLSKSDRLTKVIGNQLFVTLTLAAPIRKAQIEQIIKSSRTLLAVTDDVDVQSSGYESDPAASAALEYTAAVQRTIASLKGSERVRVAVIDTGFTNATGQFSNTFPSQALLNLIPNSVGYEDQDGHGTMVASIIASKAYGLAEGQIELIPVRASATPKFTAMQAISAIATATNMGAEVVVLPLSGLTNGCSPVVGHAIYTAIEKGVFFALSAGNGIEHLGPNYPGIGFPLVAASEDGPLNYQPTATPGCWGKFFLGAMTAANLRKDGDKLADTSNFGEEVEVAALGTDVPVINHLGKASKLDGSSASAAMLGAAAAVAMYHHKQKGFAYTPWYIENLIAESARSSSALKAAERRTRFGSVLSFGQLVKLLAQTEKMTAQERSAIPTINPRFGEGWLPGMESNLKSLRVTAEKTVVTPDESLQMKAVVFYVDKDPELDVTNDGNIVWRIGWDSFDGSPVTTASLANISSNGRITLNQANLIKLLEEQEDRDAAFLKFDVVGAYTEKQHQVFAHFPFKVVLAPAVGSKTLEIKVQTSAIQTGDRNVRLSAIQTTKSGSDIRQVDVTGSSVWESSDAVTFRPTQQAGIFDALYAHIGGSYTIKARYDGMEAVQVIQIESDNVLSYEIFSAQGNSGNITPDQTPQFVSRLNLGKTKVDLPATWLLDGAALAQNQAIVLLDVKKLAPGPHALSTTSYYNLPGQKKPVSATKTFQLDVAVERIEVTSDRVVMAAGGEALLNARVYFNNNSYQIVTGSSDLAWSVAPSGILSILPSGKATAAANAEGKTVTVTAQYKGHSEKFMIAIVGGSTVTGSQSNLVALDFDTRVGGCIASVERVTAIYKDGARRDVTKFASGGYHILTKGVQTVYRKENMIPGSKVVVRYSYNDGSTASGGGGSVQATREYLIPSYPIEQAMLYRTVFPLFGEEPTGAVQFPPCAYNQTVRAAASLSGSVKNGTANVGKHKMTAQWTDNVSGTPTQYEKTFDFEVTSATYKLIASASGAPPQPVQSTVSDARFIGWPMPYPVHFGLQTNNSGIYAAADNKYVKANVSGSVKNETTGDTASLEFWGAGGGLSYGTAYDIRAAACLEPRGPEKVVVKANDKVSGTSAQISVDVVTTTLQRPDLSSLIEPVAKLSEMPSSAPPASVCTAQQQKKAPFAAGSGTKTDPYLICSVDQFKQINTAAQYGYFELGDSLDFQNQPFEPAKGGSLMNGKGYELKNIVMVDAEKDGQAPFSGFNSVKNLRVSNVTVRGNHSVGSVCAPCTILTNVYVTNAVVSGKTAVGGVTSRAMFMRNIYAKNMQVSSDAGEAGGLAGGVQTALEHSAFSGTVRSNGTPGLGKRFGGLVGAISGAVIIRSSSMKGSVVAAGDMVGGVVGDGGFRSRNSLIVGNSVEANVVSTGTSVGGIVGALDSEDPLRLNLLFSPQYGIYEMHLPSYGAETQKFVRPISQGNYVGKNSFVGGVWGGMSAQTLKCKEGITVVLGSGGSVTCDGATLSSEGGTSGAGGLIGTLERGNIVADNSFRGTVRSVNESGGIVGLAKGYQQIYGNRVEGDISVSSRSGFAGKLLGRLIYTGCKDVPAVATRQFISDNTYAETQDLIRWDLGTYEFLSGAKEDRVNLR